MLKLDPDSEAELGEIGDEGLRRAVERVCEDPSGRGQPGHPYTRKFQDPSKYIDARGRDVWEFKPSKWRGLFVIAEKDGEQAGIFFLPMGKKGKAKGKRFLTPSECPWHR